MIVRDWTPSYAPRIQGYATLTQPALLASHAGAVQIETTGEEWGCFMVLARQ